MTKTEQILNKLAASGQSWGRIQRALNARLDDITNVNIAGRVLNSPELRQRSEQILDKTIPQVKRIFKQKRA